MSTKTKQFRSPAASGGDELHDVATKPQLARNVVVHMPQKIGGQNDHAAIITRVSAGNRVDVTVFPAGAESYPVSDIPHVADAPHGALSWS